VTGEVGARLAQRLYPRRLCRRCASPASDTTIYLHGDHLGSVSAATSATGAVLSRQAFTPWGELRAGGGDVTQTTRDYTGQLKDDTGLLFYGARYYDPKLDRFLSADSVAPGSASGQGGMAAPRGLPRGGVQRGPRGGGRLRAGAGLPVPIDAGRAAACRRGDVAVAAQQSGDVSPLTVTVHLLDLIPSPFITYPNTTARVHDTRRAARGGAYDARDRPPRSGVASTPALPAPRRGRRCAWGARPSAAGGLGAG